MLPERLSVMGRLRFVIAVGFGSGFSPLASGTAGSAVALPVIWLLVWLGGWKALLAGTVIMALVGWWAAEGASRAVGLKDPGIVVIDEIAGQMVTLLFVPLTLQTLAAGFFFFRAADVVKPFPARSSEALPGGLGIMMDDLIAGVYANLALQALVWFAPTWMSV